MTRKPRNFPCEFDLPRAAYTEYPVEDGYTRDKIETAGAIRAEKARLAAKKKAVFAAAQSNAPITLPKIGWGDL